MIKLDEKRVIEILSSHNVSQDAIKSIKIEKPPLKGENFGSATLTITVELTKGEPLNLFAKTLTSNEQYSQDIRALSLFQREASVFLEIQPLVREFVREQLGEDGASSYFSNLMPKCYYGDHELIVMENLSTKGFYMCNKIEKQDLKHSRAALDALAKYHAPSYVFMKSKMSAEELMTRFPTVLENLYETPDGQRIMEPMLISWIDTALNILEKKLIPDCEEMIEFLTKIRTNPLQHANSCHIDFKSSKFLTIVHGDSWNNNMLFRNLDGNLEVALIDFQVPTIASLVVDINYYLFGSVKPELRKNGGWKRSLEYYYSRFSHYVGMLHGSVDFTLEELEAENRQRYLYGFLVGIAGLIVMPMLNKLQEQIDEKDGGMTDFFSSGTLMEAWLQKNPEDLAAASQQLIEVFNETKEF